MKQIKIAYMDGLADKYPESYYFTRILKQKYDVVISDHPDYVFYSCFGNRHHEYDCVRIFFTGENVVPNFNYCDYALGFHHIGFEDRYMRLPLWRCYERDLDRALTCPKLSDQEALNRKFCNMVVSNSKQTDGCRAVFYDKLSTYKTVDSGGRYKNNVGGPVTDKYDFQKRYKFSFAFENMSAHGYCTEKIVQAFAANTIPIYYGDETVVQDFNPKAFINCHNYPDMNAVVEEIKRLDQDNAAYLAMLNEPIFAEGHVPDRYSDETVLKFLSDIIEQPVSKAIRRRNVVKTYADVDYVNMKNRDVRMVVKYFFIRAIRKLLKKR